MAKAKSKREVKYKWRFAIGTTSRVPGSKMHYLIADFDGPIDECYQRAKLCVDRMDDFVRIEIQETEHGLHLFSNCKMRFQDLVRCLLECGADASWVKIGSERGYLFLADKREVTLSWPVERMVLVWDESAAKKALRHT